MLTEGMMSLSLLYSLEKIKEAEIGVIEIFISLFLGLS